MKKGLGILPIIGALVVALTLVLGLLNIKFWSILTITSFIFIIVAEIILFGGLFFIKKSSDDKERIVYYSGATVITFVYTIASIIVSVLFIKLPSLVLSAYLSIQIILLVVYIILFIVMFSLAKKFKEQDDKVLSAVSQIESYINRLSILKSDNSNKPYALTFKKLAEDLRFTDISTAVSVDGKIDDTISNLESELEKNEDELSESEIERLSDELDSLIKERKIEVNSTKRGCI